MNSSVTVQQRQVPWARRALGIFVVAWLNLALLPCAMALDEVQERACPFSQPATSADTSCCDEQAARCELPGDYNYDGRTFQGKVKDAPFEMPPAIVPTILAVSAEISTPTTPGFLAPQCWSGGKPRLNVLHCVYLI